MLSNLFRGASWLDAWLHEHVGRLYTAILGWGLVAAISEGIARLVQSFGSGGGKVDLVRIVLVVALQSALLINQLAQWSELQERRRARKAARSAPPPA
jgi:hypothetical protein